jgi:hypothetical protein
LFTCQKITFNFLLVFPLMSLTQFAGMLKEERSDTHGV